ncbi:hypothetical protein PHMEG_00040129, partial [Phytophthora megakarya]
MSAAKQTPVVDASTCADVRVDLRVDARCRSRIGACFSARVGDNADTSGWNDREEILYYELQDKKLELKAKQRAKAAKLDSPKTILDGSSVLSTDGGIPVDYEDLKTRSPRLPSRMSPSPRLGIAVLAKTIRTLPHRSVREAKVMQCLPDWKHLPSPPTSVMLRALMTQCVHPGCRPRRSSRIGMGLLSLRTRYRCTSTIELSTTLKLLRSTSCRTQIKGEITTSRSFTSSGKKTSGRSKVPEWQALCQSWNQFVTNFNNDPAGYRERISSARERFVKYSVTSAVQRVHEASVNAKIPCAVPEGVHCPHCPVGAPRISERDRT